MIPKLQMNTTKNFYPDNFFGNKKYPWHLESWFSTSCFSRNPVLWLFCSSNPMNVRNQRKRIEKSWKCFFHHIFPEILFFRRCSSITTSNVSNRLFLIRNGLLKNRKPSHAFHRMWWFINLFKTLKHDNQAVLKFHYAK